MRGWKGSIGTVDGLGIDVYGDRREDVERHMRALDHEGSSGWDVRAVGLGAEDAVRTLLRAIGEDPDREGLRETPGRVLRMLQEMCRREAFRFTTFASEGMNEMVVQAPIPVRSLCEHHMLPFVGTAAVAYIPNGKIVGLSKLARAVDYCARGLQNQERITTAVADMLQRELEPAGVGVVIRARHMCMELRGVRAADVYTTTSCLRGALLDDGKARDEFLRLAGEAR